MGAQIFPIPMGSGQSFLIRDQGVILVDCGQKNQHQAFLHGLEKAGIQPNEVRLIVVTHGHYDHIGSARAIKEITGAPLAMHRLDAPCLEHGVIHVPPGVTPLMRLVLRLMARFAPPGMQRVDSTTVDHLLGDDCMQLNEYGVRGQIVYTPGHTKGSVSVLLDDGTAIVGDLSMNMPPLRVGPGFPALAEDLGQVKQSIRWLLDAGARVFYPAHGGPIPAERFAQA